MSAVFRVVGGVEVGVLRLEWVHGLCHWVMHGLLLLLLLLLVLVMHGCIELVALIGGRLNIADGAV